MLRLLRDAFGVVFKVKEEKVDNPSRTTLVLSCLGVGYKNMARRVAS